MKFPIRPDARGFCSLTILFGVAATVQASDPAPQADQNPPASSATRTAPTRIGVKSIRSTAKNREPFYPPRSVKNREEGTCYVYLFVDTDGSLRRATIKVLRGRLESCFDAFSINRMMPATLDGKPVG